MPKFAEEKRNGCDCGLRLCPTYVLLDHCIVLQAPSHRPKPQAICNPTYGLLCAVECTIFASSAASTLKQRIPVTNVSWTPCLNSICLVNSNCCPGGKWMGTQSELCIWNHKGQRREAPRRQAGSRSVWVISVHPSDTRHVKDTWAFLLVSNMAFKRLLPLFQAAICWLFLLGHEQESETGTYAAHLRRQHEVVSPRRFHSVHLGSSKDRGICLQKFTHSQTSDVEIHRAMSLLNASRSFAFVWVLGRHSNGYDPKKRGQPSARTDLSSLQFYRLDSLNKGTTKEQGDFRLCCEEGRTANATVHLISTSSHTANYCTSNTNQDRSLQNQPLANVCHPKKAKILHKNTIVVTCRKLRTRNANQARCPASSELQLLPAHGMEGIVAKVLSMCFSQFQENESVIPLQHHGCSFYASHLNESYA